MLSAGPLDFVIDTDDWVLRKQLQHGNLIGLRSEQKDEDLADALIEEAVETESEYEEIDHHFEEEYDRMPEKMEILRRQLKKEEELEH